MQNWIKILLSAYNRQEVIIHFDQHTDIRAMSRNIDIDIITETVRAGKILGKKCDYPNKLCFYQFWNDGYTYVAIVRVYPSLFVVKTVWKKQGRI